MATLSVGYFRQGLASNLHFRQWKLRNSRLGVKVKFEITRGFVNLRQVIASTRGKELVQVTVLWPVAWFVRRHYSRKLELTSRQLLFRVLVRVVFALDLIFIVALFALVTYGLTHLEIFSDRGTIWFHILQILGILGALGTLIVLVNAVLTWIGKRGFWVKLQATLMFLASIGVLWFEFAGNLLRISSNY